MRHPLVSLKRSSLVRSVAALLLRWRVRCSAAQVGLVVCYHGVEEGGGRLVPSVPRQLLRKQLAHARQRYHVVALGQLRRAASQRRRGDRIPLAITFDDDLVQHARVAAPECAQAGVAACFFLCGASLSEPFVFWWEDLERLGGETIVERAAEIERLPPANRDAIAAELRVRAGAMPDDAGIRADQVRQLAAAGFEIGFHTRGHYLLTTLDDEQLEHELRNGRKELEALTGKPLRTLAYPHGKADRRIARAAARAGFTEAFTSQPVPVAPDGDPHLLGRVDAAADSASNFALALALALTRSYPRAATTAPEVAEATD